MNILILGMGSVGCLYGSLFNRAGHNVEHFLRKPLDQETTIKVDLLDGRLNSKGETVVYDYTIKTDTRKEYDFIFVSVPESELKEAIEDLRSAKIHGTVLLFSSIWMDHRQLHKIMGYYKYVLGYPNCGGAFQNATLLKAVIHDYVMIESKPNCHVDNYNLIMSLFKSCDISFEIPHDMLEWMWVRIALNAAIVSTVARYGNLNYPEASSMYVVKNGKSLRHLMRTIRETLMIAKGRGINMNHFRQEIMPFKFPALIAAQVFRVTFNTNRLVRETILRSNNIEDLLNMCYEVFLEGKQQCVEMPHFIENMEALLVSLEEQEHAHLDYYRSVTHR